VSYNLLGFCEAHRFLILVHHFAPEFQFPIMFLMKRTKHGGLVGDYCVTTGITANFSWSNDNA